MKIPKTLPMWGLNILMALGGLILLATAAEAWQRQQAVKEYEELAWIRQEDLWFLPEPTPPAETPEETPAGEAAPVKDAEGFSLQPNPQASFLVRNPDFAGWLTVPGTNIDYPYVRSKDNAEYLNLSFDRKPSALGTIFMDYRNLGGFTDRHLILYGHNSKNGTMFHELVKFHDKEFLKAHGEIRITDLYVQKTYRVISVYEISANDYTLPVDFSAPPAFAAYLADLLQRSLHPLEGKLPPDAKLLTLVTCSYGVNNGRTIVHAVEVGSTVTPHPSGLPGTKGQDRP